MFLFLSVSSTQAGQLKYRVEGLDNDLEQNVRLFLESLPDIEARHYQSSRKKIIDTTHKALQALGYYQPDIQEQLKGDTLSLNMSSGNPVLLRDVSIQLLGDARQSKAFKRLLSQTTLKKGAVLNQGKYEALKGRLNSLSLTLGFFDAHVIRHTIKVYPEQQAADIDLILDSGVRYRVGDIQFGKMPDSIKKLIEKLIRFKPGSRYRLTKLNNLNRDLAATGYFKSISIEPLRDQSHNHHIPIKIDVTLNTDHELETGVGFSTNEGIRLSLSWDRPLINDSGHSMSSELFASKPRIQLTGNYKIPYGNPLLEFYNLQLGYQYKEQEDTRSNLTTASVHQWKKQLHGWDRDFFFRIQQEGFRQGQERGNSFLTIPGVSLTRRKANSTLEPSQGYLLMGKLEGAHKYLGSDQEFIKAWGRAKWLTTLNKRHRLLLRGEQGAIAISDITQLPPSIRFFTGGDQSIRGYDFESIAPKNSAGKLVGGQYLTVFSTEYNYQFIKKWWAAAFIDHGTSTNDYSDSWKTGVGLGLRWVTPFGAVRADVAFAVSDKGSPWRLHFTMGPEL
nr:autotransporter assembly complex family protein [Endozoicomonas sp. OPT23]